MVNCQTHFKKYALPRARQRQGYFFQHLFENEPYLAYPIFKITIWLVFLKFHYLVGLQI